MELGGQAATDLSATQLRKSCINTPLTDKSHQTPAPFTRSHRSPPDRKYQREEREWSAVGRQKR